jgi:hypothetical protein
MPLLGGPVRRILDRVFAMAVSPDRTRIAFTRRDTATTSARLMTASLDGTDVKELARTDPPDFFSAPTWSRDGSLVAVSV